MTKIRRLEPYGFNEQSEFNGLANTVKANIENIKEKNHEQDKKDESQDENIKQAIDKSVVSLEMLSTPTEGSNRTYAVKQGGNEIGKIEIPFSSLVKSTTYDAEKNLLIFTIDNDKNINVNLTDLIKDADLVQRKIFDDFKNEVLASLNDLNDRKLDASAYTSTDLSDYYKKEETSGKSEIDTALAAKSNTGHKHPSSDISDIVTGITASNSDSTSVPTVNAVMQLINAKLDINYTGFTGTTLTGITTIIGAIQKIADKLDRLPNS